MIKKNIVILVSIFTIAVSCKKSDKEQFINDKKTEIIKINPLKGNNMQPRVISSENVEYIPLETTDGSAIGRIDRIQIFEGNYFIIDQRNAKGIYIFDKEGRFLKKINPFGRGPHEITFMDDVVYNKITKQIEIYDSTRKKILVYTLNGDFIKEFDTKVYIRSFYPIKKNERYYYTSFRTFKGNLDTDKNYRLLIMDEKANLLSSYFSYKDSQADQTITQLKNNFFPIDNSNKVFFLEPYSNNIFELNGNTVILKYKMDFINANIPDNLLDSDELNKIGAPKANVDIKNKLAILKNILFEDKDELVIWYVKDNVYRELHYDKKSKESYEFQNCFVTKDNVYLPINEYVTKNFSFSVIEPMNLLKENINNYSQRIQKILRHTKSTDNPIIVKIKR